jgi:hypothetical protein
MTFEESFDKSYQLGETEYKRAFKSKVLPAYKEAYKQSKIALQKAYANLNTIDPEEYLAKLSEYKRLETLNRELKLISDTASKKAGKALIDSSRAAISNTYYRQKYIMDWIKPTKTFLLPQAVIDVSVLGTPKVWAGIDKRTRDQIIKRFGNLQSYQAKYGTLQSILLANNQAQLTAIQQAVTSGLALGENVTSVSRRIRNIFETSASKALRIARTETHRNMMAGNFAMTNAVREAGLDARRQIQSTMDTRARKQSAQVDDKKENNEGFFVYPGGRLVRFPGNSGVAGWDINDRERVLTIVNGVEPELRRARNPITGETDIVGYQSIPQWMEENNLRFNNNGIMVSSG